MSIHVFSYVLQSFVLPVKILCFPIPPFFESHDSSKEPQGMFGYTFDQDKIRASLELRIEKKIEK